MPRACVLCDATIPDGTAFCAECGKMPACASCGSPASDTAVFCERCGKRVAPMPDLGSGFGGLGRASGALVAVLFGVLMGMLALFAGVMGVCGLLMGPRRAPEVLPQAGFALLVSGLCLVGLVAVMRRVR